MKLASVNMLLLLAFTLAVAAEARITAASGRKRGDIHKEIQVYGETLAKSPISPPLHPKSGEKLFKTDYPRDKKPSAVGLHFTHPYPVVQDSADFDKDFVKDQNKDNGEWVAQHEYDRLRNKLAQLQKRAKEALGKKSREKTELDEVMETHREELAKRKADIAKQNDNVKPVKREVKHVEVTIPRKEAPVWSWEWPWGWKSPKPKQEPARADKKPTEVATTPQTPIHTTPKPVDTSGVEEAKANLQDCKEQLAAAKADLNKVMDKLEMAKPEQIEARKKAEQAAIKQLESDKKEKQLHGTYTAQAEKSAAAETAYLKQKELLYKDQAEFQAAAAKVKAMRAAEDKSGGVYPKPSKSAASSVSHYSQLLVVALVVFVLVAVAVNEC